MKLEPMDPQHPERRRMVYVPMRPTRNWLTNLVDASQLIVLSVLLLGGLYTVWSLTQ